MMLYPLGRREAIALVDAGYMPVARYAEMIARGCFDSSFTTAGQRDDRTPTIPVVPPPPARRLGG